MLARFEEALRSSREDQASEEMKAIDKLLKGLIDYAGLYPPASCNMRAAVCNYLSYGASRHAAALGRFIVNVERLSELREVAGDSFCDMKLSVIASPDSDWDSLKALCDDGTPIDMIEIKTHLPSEIERIAKLIPLGVITCFEVPVHPVAEDALAAISILGARVKLRMGGIVANAFPSVGDTCKMLNTLAHRGLALKATAGLHYPVRSNRPLTYEMGSPVVKMHGFLNLICAAALLHFGGEDDQAQFMLDEENVAAWQMNYDSIGWRSHSWTADQLSLVRKRLFISFGSCSFDEPIHELEALGWL